jgi:hypothetical protein
MNSLKLAATAVLATLCTAAAAGTAPAAPAAPLKTLDEIQACMSRNLVTRAALRDLKVDVADREGNGHGLRMKLYWKPAANGDVRVNLRLVEPLPMKDSGYLLLQNGGNEEVYFHLPTESHAIRITGKNTSEPLWGTDFSYGEIKQVLGLLYSGDTVVGADGVYATRPAYVLETTTDLDTTGYRKVVSYVDQGTCVLLKSQFYVKGDVPLKVLEADPASILTLDQYSVVLGYGMRNLEEGTRTKVELSDFTLLERLPESLFDPKRFFEPFD